MAPKKKNKKKAEAKAKVKTKAEKKPEAKGKNKAQGKGKAEAKDKGKAKDKAKDKDKGQGKAEAKKQGQAKDKAKDKGKAEAKDKGKGKDKAKDKGKAEAKDKSKAKDKDKGKGKKTAKGKGEAKAKGKGKGKGKGKDKVKAPAQPDQIAMQMVTPKELAALEQPDDEPAEAPADADPARTKRAPPVAARPAQRRWERVAARLGLQQHARAVSGWDGQGDPPLLSGFSFVRHVESDARDLRCTATRRPLTQAVIVQREDGKLFLVGRGVAQTYLGLPVPRKDRANAGQRFLTPLEREALGQSPG